MNQNGSCAEASAQRSSRKHMEAQNMSFVEALAKDDIDAVVEVILSRENCIIQELNKYLQHQDFLNERRKEMLHKRWVENVACPLQQKIIEKVGSPREIEKRKCLEREGYRRFRDITVTLPPFHDPLLQAQENRDEDNRAILQCETGKMYTMKEFKEIEKAKWLAKLPQSLARQNMNPSEWLKVPAAYVESEFRQRSRLKVKVNRNQLSVDFRKSLETNGEVDEISQKDVSEEFSRICFSPPKQLPDLKLSLEMTDEKQDSVPTARKHEEITVNDNPSVTDIPAELGHESF
ncbi:protein FAM228B-like [Macrotis lagotis]|uniref:protein FAM228B-like n=1 Tax=Macrotis lagotis TaxID=92651 RepID=UPI003D68A058